MTENIYRHFKGGYYKLLHVASDVNVAGRAWVVYQQCDESGVEDTSVVPGAREFNEFFSEVPEDAENPTGQKKRFQKVRERGGDNVSI